MEGTWTIGAITTESDGGQSAPVSGSGKLHLYDFSNFELTADLVWNDIKTKDTAGNINLSAIVNLTSISYAGNVEDFKTLATPGIGSEVVSFSFNPACNLTTLTTDGRVSATAFSGVLKSSTTSVPDNGTTAMLLGLALVGLYSMTWLRRVAVHH
jgi:hypothetical protein